MRDGRRRCSILNFCTHFLRRTASKSLAATLPLAAQITGPLAGGPYATGECDERQYPHELGAMPPLGPHVTQNASDEQGRQQWGQQRVEPSLASREPAAAHGAKAARMMKAT